MKINNHAHGEFTSPGEIRFRRMLPGPVERVWAYLTDPAKRATWLARGSLEPRVGGRVQLEFHNTKLTTPVEEIPKKYQVDCADGCGFTGRVTCWQPPTLLSHSWGEADGSESEVTFELTPQGDEVLLILTHRKLGTDLAMLTSVAAGWHTHAAIMLARLNGTPPSPFWSTHTRLESEYEKILHPATKATVRP